jgi:uncharacterized protein YndB with AHSA1/START domain
MDRTEPDRTERGDIEVMRVERTVQLDAPASEVWRHVSRLDELAGWLGLELDGAHEEVDGADARVRVGVAARAVDADGSVRHLLVSEVDEGTRLAWHWWRDDGELSAVEVTLEPLDGEGSTIVRVVETLAVTAAGAGGRPALELAAGIDDRWASVLPTLGARLARKLGVG